MEKEKKVPQLNNIQSIISDTPLMTAARNGDIAQLKHLLTLETEITINQVNNNLQTALVCSIINKQRLAIQKICESFKNLEQVAKFKEQINSLDFNDEEKTKTFALHKINNVYHMLRMKEILESRGIKIPKEE